MLPTQQSSSKMPGSFSAARCLVLGGGGFIGINLSNQLAQAGARVHAYGRRLLHPTSLSPAVNWTAADIANRSTLAAAIETADFVFHLISSSTPSSANADPIADINENVASTIHLLNNLRLRPSTRIIFVSSGGTVYGVPFKTPVPETAPTDPITAYGIQKLVIEKYLALYRHLYGLDYIVLRLSNPYGPLQIAHKNQGLVAAVIKRALEGEPIEIWGSGEVVRDFVYIDDVVRAILMAAMHSGPLRLFNVGSGTGISINAVVDDVERVIGRGPIQRIHLPGRPSDVPVNILDIHRIREEIGWIPQIEWTAGLHETVSWMIGLTTHHDITPPRRRY